MPALYSSRLFLYLQYLERNSEPLVPFKLFADRNFSTMNFVVASIGFGMLGLFLPLTIYLQSVLGLTALQAGLTTAPMSLISMFVAPVAGRFADRVGGKWILFVGVALFAGGMGILIDSAHVDSTRLHLLPGLIVAGFGLGMTFAPLQTIAMRDVEPRMAGAASGIINTTRQLGAVIGSAAVGALLQSQLSAKLGGDAQAQINGPLKDVVPPSFHEQFVSGFKDAASAGLEVTGRPSVPELGHASAGAVTGPDRRRVEGDLRQRLHQRHAPVADPADQCDGPGRGVGAPGSTPASQHASHRRTYANGECGDAGRVMLIREPMTADVPHAYGVSGPARAGRPGVSRGRRRTRRRCQRLCSPAALRASAAAATRCSYGIRRAFRSASRWAAVGRPVGSSSR